PKPLVFLVQLDQIAVTGDAPRGLRQMLEHVRLLIRPQGSGHRHTPMRPGSDAEFPQRMFKLTSQRAHVRLQPHRSAMEVKSLEIIGRLAHREAPYTVSIGKIDVKAAADGLAKLE